MKKTFVIVFFYLAVSGLSIFFRTIKFLQGELGVVAHACNPSTWEAETGGSGFVTSFSYLVRPSATL